MSKFEQAVDDTDRYFRPQIRSAMIDLKDMQQEYRSLIARDCGDDCADDLETPFCGAIESLEGWL